MGGCEYQIYCKGKTLKCDGNFCLRDTVFELGLPYVVRILMGISLEEAKKSAYVKNNDCKSSVINLPQQPPVL